MKILVVDREDVAFNMIKSKLGPMGHSVMHQAVKNAAVEQLAANDFDMLMLDPSPLTSPKPVILNIRRTVKYYPYILMMSESGTREEAIKSGTNDILHKPLDALEIVEKVANADRLLKLVKRMGDDSEDFPSAGGVIAKSAFNQLFLSGIDRADRYGERTYMLFIALSNYTEIRDMDGPKAADYAAAKLSQYLVLLRRQSDIIGQTAKSEYALMLQRPVYDTEPVEAANRFADSLAGIKEISSAGSTPVKVSVTLLTIPTGAKMIEHILTPGQKK